MTEVLAHGVKLTDTAVSKVKALLAAEGRDDLRLRVAVEPGGCSGLIYQLFFDEQLEEVDSTRSTRSLVGTGLANGLDRQALHLQPGAVAGDAGSASIDYKLDVWNRQRSFGNVGGENYALLNSCRFRRLKDPVLLRRTESTIER